jgi:hypothetical protein
MDVVSRPFRLLAQAGNEYLSGRMLERRPLMQANLLRNFSVAVEQTLIILACTGALSTRDP